MEVQVKEISPEEVNTEAYKNYQLIDVRGADEYVGEFGHAVGAKLVTLGEAFDSWLMTQEKDNKIIFICRSGGRSGRATQAALEKGFTNVLNMKGGMIRWTELGLLAEDKN